MRRMYSDSELREFIRVHGGDVAASLLEKDINVNGIISKGIANTGELANIGDAVISGDLSVSGAITGDSIIQNMSGYSFTKSATGETDALVEYTYVSACINGNKLTLVISGYVTKVGTPSSINLGFFEIPQALFNQLIPNTIGSSADSALDFGVIQFASNYNSRIAIPYLMLKNTGSGKIQPQIYNTSSLTANTKYSFRLEHTFLFSENLAPEE